MRPAITKTAREKETTERYYERQETKYLILKARSNKVKIQSDET